MLKRFLKKVINKIKSKLHKTKKDSVIIKIKYNKQKDRININSGNGNEHYNRNSIILFLKMFYRYKPEFKKSFNLTIYAADVVPKRLKCLTFTHNNQNNNAKIIPDPFFDSWEHTGCNSFEEFTQEIEKAGAKAPIYNKLFWIGCISTHELRKKLPELSQQNENFEFIAMDWLKGETKYGRHNATTYVSLPDHCKYKYLLEVRGFGWSGRVKFLLYSQRPIFYVERDCKGWQEEGLQPFVHYIPVKEDLSNLQEMYEWAENNPDKCKEIAQNALNFAKEKFSLDNILEEYKNIVFDFI